MLGLHLKKIYFSGYNLTLIFFLNLGFYYNVLEYRHKYLNKQHISIRKISLRYFIDTTESPEESPQVTSELKVFESIYSVGQDGFTYQVLV